MQTLGAVLDVVLGIFLDTLQAFTYLLCERLREHLAYIQLASSV